jgi:multidrug resistance efflux pump
VFDIKAKAATEVMWVGVKPGDAVYAGQALATLDSTTAQQAVDSAKANLATTKLQLQQDTAQAPITFQKANDQLTTDTTNLQTEYTNAWNTIANTYLFCRQS